jgi:nicotinamidase/pyrazinamidase
VLCGGVASIFIRKYHPLIELPRTDSKIVIMSSSNVRTALLIIDPQIDFHPGGSLAVAGADKDAERTAELIRQQGPKITNIIITLDSHHLNHVAHHVAWVNQAGEHPAPFTLISAEEIKAGVWKAADPKRQQLVQKYAEDLEAKGRFKLIIWPDHCIISSRGHNVQPCIHEASQEWVKQTGKQVHYVRKGENVNTEMYSAIQAEVPDEKDKSTSLNQHLINQLRSFDRVIVCGQALSHCVNFTVRDIVDNWNRDNSDIIVLTDGCSPVGGFEAAGQEFLQFCRDNGLTLHTCQNVADAWSSFTPSPNKGPMVVINTTASANLAGVAKQNERLGVATANRRTAETQLNRLLSRRARKNYFANSLKTSPSAIAHLNKVAAAFNSTVDEAVLGSNGTTASLAKGADGFNADDLRFVVGDERAVVREDNTERFSSLSEDQAVAIRLLTYSSHKLSIAALVNKPFIEDGVSSDVANIVPFTGVLAHALRTYANATGYFRGTAFRGGKFSESQKMQSLFDKVSSGAADKPFDIGSTVVFPSFSTVLADEAEAASHYGSDYVFVVNFAHDFGVDVSKISYFQISGEIAIIPPAAFKVANIEVANSKLVVTLDSVPSDVSYI